jgi:hypothetical protein
VLTGHTPTADALCLAHALSYDGNVGTDPAGAAQPGADVWGGALDAGAFVFVLVNRDAAAAARVAAPFAALEAPGVGADSAFCVTELFSGAKLGLQTGAAAMSVPAMDAAVLRLDPVPPAGC